MPESELSEHIKRSKNRKVFSQSGDIGEMIRREEDGSASSSSSGSEKGLKTRDEEAHAVMKKMKPLVYPISHKDVKFF